MLLITAHTTGLIWEMWVVYAVPFTIFGWEHPPLCPSPSNPQYGINEPPTFGFLPSVQVCLTPKELMYP